jgi:hypothetical protein
MYAHVHVIVSHLLASVAHKASIGTWYHCGLAYLVFN